MDENKKDKKTGRKTTYSPYIPQGVFSIGELLELVETLKNEGAKTVKLGGEMVFVWDETGPLSGEKAEKLRWDANDFKAKHIRPVKLCSAETFCQNFKQPVISLAAKLDEKFRKAPVPSKLVIGVAGCHRSCSEPATKDIGIMACTDGYEIMVGGAAGLRPMIAKSIGTFKTEEETIEIVEKVIAYFKKDGRQSVRLGRLLEKNGIDHLLKFLKAR